MEVCLRQITKVNPKILFRSSGEGIGKNCLIVGLHKNYRDYVDFLTSIRERCKGVKTDFDSFLAPTTKEHVLDFATPVTHLIKKDK